MGAVYEGVNTRIHRRVAIKVLHAGVAQNAEAVQRFEREAQAAGRIGSEHIVEVLDLGNLPDGDRYMVMEFLEGESLSERIRSRGGMSPGELYPIAVQMLDALAAAHQAGIIHRDLKPDNVFLLNQRGGRADFVKLLDFGISKFSQLNKDSGFSMTRTGAVMGTPYYLAPEQAKGAKDIDRRVDLYAAGVILYEACTGQVPFNADTFNELLFKIVLESPRKPEELVPSLDPAFSAIVLKGMAREAADRYPSAEAFREALEQWASNAGPGVFAAAAAAPRPAMGSFADTRGGVPAGTPTPGTWSQTGAGLPVAAPPAKRRPMVAAFAGIGALVVLVGGGVAWKMSSDAAEAAAAAEQRAAAELLEAQQKAAEAQAKLEEERAEADRAKAEAEQARLEAEKAAKDAAALKDRKAREEAEKAAAEKERLAREAEAKAQQQRSRVNAAAAAVKAQPAKAPAKGSPAPTSTGRKIRTSL